MYNPLVSIICPTYNQAHYLDECIMSVLSQDYNNYELIILDDGSKDNTKKIVEKYLKDKRIKYFRQKNVGFQNGVFAIDKVVNRCVELSSGELLCFTAGDDVLTPNRISRQVSEFENNPELDICFSDGYHIDSNSRILPTDFKNVESIAFSRNSLCRMLFQKNFIASPTYTMTRNAFYRMGGHETGYASDYHFLLKSAPFLNFKYIDEKLVKYRISEQGISNNPSNREFLITESRSVITQIRERLDILDIYPEIEVCRDKEHAMYSAHVDLGNRLLKGAFSHHQQAIKEYKKALEYNADGLEAWNNLALALWLAGEYEESKRLLKMFSIDSKKGFLVLLEEKVCNSELMRLIIEDLGEYSRHFYNHSVEMGIFLDYEYIDSSLLKNVVVFGAGILGEECYRVLHERNVTVEFFIDNSRFGTSLLGIPVYKVENILDDKMMNKVDAIIISSSAYSNEMYQQLRGLGYCGRIIRWFPINRVTKIKAV